jgi:ubiquinone/menaquinone biosynthesis C-methylase UbiE
MPEAYDRSLGSAVFRPFAVDLARRAAHLEAHRVLELAAGSGVLTRELVAALPAADLTATDLNTAMVEFGSHRVPEATWEQADALHLPFPDNRFDLIVCQFGVMFFPDKPAAFAEARRVLAPGGRVLFNTWGPVEMHGFARALVAALERTLPDHPPTFVTAVAHGYTNPDLISSDLKAAGLDAVSIEIVTLEGHADSAADIAAGFCTGTPLRLEIESRADVAATTAAVGDDMTTHLGAGPVAARMTAYVIEARRSI